MSGALTAKQQRFVAEYLIDLNATQAAIRSGYSAKTAKQIGCENLAKPDIAAAIAAKRAKIADKLDVTAERIICELAKLGFSNMRDYLSDEGKLSMPLDDRDKMAAVGEYVVEATPLGTKTRFKLADKRAPLVDLGKHLGMFVERSESKTDVTLRNAVDRPSRETREQWIARRSKELGIDPRLMGATAGAAD
jgi:phage terminase small subunit